MLERVNYRIISGKRLPSVLFLIPIRGSIIVHFFGGYAVKEFYLYSYIIYILWPAFTQHSKFLFAYVCTCKFRRPTPFLIMRIQRAH